MSVWTCSPSGALLTSEERWLAVIGLLWAPFTGTYTSLCHSAGAPAVMWIGSGLMTLYGVWIAILSPAWTRWTRAGHRYEVDSGGFRVLGRGGREVRRLVHHDLADAWLEDGPGGTRQLWTRTRDGAVEVLFVGIQAGSAEETSLCEQLRTLRRES